MSITSLIEELREFNRARDWARFHSPKNLSMALIAEAAEVVEHFQWSTEEESCQLAPEKRTAVASELADVFIYLLLLADVTGVNLELAAREKIKANARKYPAPE